MRQLVWIAAALVAAALTPPLASASSTERAITLRLLERQASFHVQDNPPLSTSHRVSAGDTLQFTNELLTERGKRAGTAYVSCVVVTGGDPERQAAMTCTGTFGLAGGQIDVAATLRKGLPRIAIIGGTGAYEGARGSIRSLPRKHSMLVDDTLHILLP